MCKKKNKSRAQSMVELALVLPIMILVVMGLIEFGRALFIYTVVSNAAREGVRAGLVDPLKPEWITGRIQARLVLVNPADVTIHIECDDGTDNTFVCSETSVVAGETRIRITVETPFQMITPVLRDVFPPTTIRYVSARTIVAGARAHKPTEISEPPPPPPPQPGALVVSFVGGFPCRGREADPSGNVRAEVYVADGAGNPITTATVTLDLEGASLEHIGGGHYGASGQCWTSSSMYSSDLNVVATASATGHTNGSATGSTSGNRCTGGCSSTPPELVLNIEFAPNYPCKGNGTKPVRVKAYVTDQDGNPVTDAQVSVSVGTDNALLDHIGGGYYGSGTSCWVSPTSFPEHQNVTVGAAKAGYQGASTTKSTALNGACNNNCP